FRPYTSNTMDLGQSSYRWRHIYAGGNIYSSGSIDAGTQFLGVAGDSAAAPSFSFTGSTNTGIWRASASQIGFSTAGTNRMTLTNTGLAVNGNISSNGVITAASNSASDEASL